MAALAVRAVWYAAVGALVASWAATAATEDKLAPNPHAILSTAFTNRYEVDTISKLVLHMRNRAGHERRRSFHTVSKMIDGRLHSIGRLIEPEYLRGMTIMVEEADGRMQDSFVFLPSLNRVRRVTTAQRGDSFLGSDLTYEDFERQFADDFDLEFRPDEEVEGERCWVIEGKPRKSRNYDRVRFSIAKRDHSILRARYYKRGVDVPYRVIDAPRASMQEEAGHVLPTRIRVTNDARGTITDVVFHELEIGPEIDDRVFSVRTLEQERMLPETQRRGGEVAK